MRNANRPTQDAHDQDNEDWKRIYTHFTLEMQTSRFEMKDVSEIIQAIKSHTLQVKLI